MEWNKDNIEFIINFINKELSAGRPMIRIELDDFGVNERVIHKRLVRLGYKKIDNQYVYTDDITCNITPSKPSTTSNITDDISTHGFNGDIDMDKLQLLLNNIDVLLKLIPSNDNILDNLKSGVNEVRSLRIDTGLYLLIKERAAKNNQSISDIVNKALQDYLNRYI